MSGIGHIGESGHYIRTSVETLSTNAKRVTQQVVEYTRGVFQFGRSGVAIGYVRERVVEERSFIKISVTPPADRQQPSEGETVRRGEEGTVGREPAPEEGEGRPKGGEAGEEKQAPPSPEKLPGGSPPPRGLLPEMNPEGLPRMQGPSAGAPSAPAPSSTPGSDRGGGLSRGGPAPSTTQRTAGGGSPPPAAAPKAGGAPPQQPPSITRLAEPLTPQERMLFIAMVKQASEQMQVLFSKEVFQKMMTPGEAVSPMVRGFAEKMNLFESLLQKFSSSPNLPLRKELSELKEIGTRILSLPDHEEAQEKMEQLLQGPLKSRMENIERAISSLPQKEETEMEELLQRLVELPEISETPLPAESRAEKVPYPISLQFATQVRSREELAFAIRAMEAGTKKDSTTPLVLIPLPWERKSEGVQAGGGKSLEKGRGGSKAEAQMGQQAMVYVPPGGVFIGKPEEKHPRVELPGYFIGVVPITNFHIASWLNALVREGSLSVKSGKVYYNRHTFILRTRESAFESQIETRVVGNSLSFGVEKGSEEHPIVHITYKGAELYCADMGLRLPTEAEWERAAGMKGDEKFEYGFSRNELDPTWANYDRGKGRAGTNCTTPVGFYNGLHLFAHQGKSLVTKNAVSPWGCYDMSGNVYDWVQDGIAKGGSYLSTAEELQVGARRVLDPNETYPDVSFRLALSI
ncbi:MAG: SUMF1/EgtB/PvdO family nonheme iron enzyme [Verrucomicrobia bacterium]|nr:SUMF1/EgtB/PvdO family nonheme iron enzyme [Verrucomicrobiota bacterium]